MSSVLETQIGPQDSLAAAITEMWVSMNNERHDWLSRVTDTRKYVTAPTTAFTEVGSSLPWKNKTTIPILTQIADNLQSYYMAALMPTDDWFRWQGATMADMEKANLIEKYMASKLRASGFREKLGKCVRDWIITGNTLGSVEHTHEKSKSLVTGEELTVYYGPKLKRISPINSVIDIHADDFASTPVLIRKMVPLVDVLSYNEDSGQPVYDEAALATIREFRSRGDDKDFVQQFIDAGIRVDGHDSFGEYLEGQYIELLEFWGDVYDPAKQQLHKNKVITIADRCTVLRNKENPSWSGKKPMAHSGWRVLPDNLYGQGPLDNIVGMQYRIDHLENLKADAWDQIAHPMIKITGDNVEDFEFGPGQKAYCNDGDIEFLRPDTTVLNSDNQIALYRSWMEISAGSPRESAGFRTPGEKTAFEVNVLQQGADRMFQDKLNHFEETFIAPILNLFYETAMRNFDVVDYIETFDDMTGAAEMVQITKEQVVANGKFRPIGAKHFAARNKRIQELQNFMAMSESAKMSPHISGLNAAKMFEDELGFEKWNLVEENIGVIEQGKSQQVANEVMQMLQQGGQENPEDVE